MYIRQAWKLRYMYVQATTVIVETVIVESTVLVEQKPLTTTQFYLLQTTILVETTVIVEQNPLTVFSTTTAVAWILESHLSRWAKIFAIRRPILKLEYLNDH